MSASDVNTAMAAAVAALGSGDYATALDQALIAQGYMAVLPDSSRGTQKLDWDFEKINAFVKNVQDRWAQSRATALGIQRTKITYARTSD